METCTKKIINKNWLGKQEWICGKPVVENTEGIKLCAKHYKKRQLKMTNWIDRPGYTPATLDNLKNGTSLKLKNTHIHNLYKRVSGTYVNQFNSVTGKYDIITNIIATTELFCVKM